MIADVLCEARTDIEQYLEAYPGMYGEIEAEVRAVCAAMALLQRTLDHPFGFVDFLAPGEPV